MYFTTPESLFKHLAASPTIQKQTLDGIGARSDFYLRNRHAEPSQPQYAKAARYLTQITGLLFSTPQIQEILSLFPFVRIDLAEDGLCPGVKSELRDVAANYFLHCRWLIYSDRVDPAIFLETLRRQGKWLGFTPVASFSTQMSPEKRKARFFVITNDTKS